jgi:hypothetical protein
MPKVSLHTYSPHGCSIQPTYRLRSRPAALRFVLDAFDTGVEPRGARIDLPDRSTLTLYNYGHRVAHLIGNERLVTGFADLIAQDTNWRVHPQPRPGTPLARLLPRLGTRNYKLLLQEGFATVEQVADAPDEALLTIPRLGRKIVTAIRDAVAAHEARLDALAATLTRAEADEVVALLDQIATVPTHPHAQRADAAAALIRRQLHRAQPPDQQ